MDINQSGGDPLFPGTIDLNGKNVIDLVYDILMELIKDGFTKIFIMNAHFENEAFVVEAMDLVNRDTHGVATIIESNWWDPMPEDVIDKVFDEVPFSGWAFEEIDNALDLITVNGAKTMHIQDEYGLEEGKPANFIVLEAKSEFDAVCERAGILASVLKSKIGYPRISLTVPSIVIMVPGLYLYRAIYNLGVMSLQTSASWFAAAILIILALPLGLIFARILTDKTFRYCT